MGLSLIHAGVFLNRNFGFNSFRLWGWCKREGLGIRVAGGGFPWRIMSWDTINSGHKQDNCSYAYTYNSKNRPSGVWDLRLGSGPLWRPHGCPHRCQIRPQPQRTQSSAPTPKHTGPIRGFPPQSEKSFKSRQGLPKSKHSCDAEGSRALGRSETCIALRAVLRSSTVTTDYDVNDHHHRHYHDDDTDTTHYYEYDRPCVDNHQRRSLM